MAIWNCLVFFVRKNFPQLSPKFHSACEHPTSANVAETDEQCSNQITRDKESSICFREMGNVDKEYEAGKWKILLPI